VTFWTRVVGAMEEMLGNDGAQYDALIASALGRQGPASPRAHYDLLRALYYNDMATDDAGGEQVTIGLRNPTKAVVEFYAATMWPGALPQALPIDVPEHVDNPDDLIAAIHQIWQWSNWGAQKQVYARNDAMLGDSFIKVATHSDRQGKVDRVFMQLIKADNVTDFDVDERNYLTYIRLDVPSERREADKLVEYIHTEVWDKRAGTYRVWEHDLGLEREIVDLGKPKTEKAIESFGFDFIPFVHGKHIDLGNKRGDARIIPALVKAHEASRMATRLHNLMFQYNRADLVLFSNLTDENGKPLRPPMLNINSDNEMTVGGQRMYALPSGWDMRPSIANLPYDAHRQVLAAHIEHLQTTDLPELGYYRVSEATDLSGKAIRYMLIPAIANAEEARGNGEGVLVRGQQMACTIGAHHRLRGFEKLGRFEDGQLDHSFREREIIPLSDEERAEVDKTRAEAAIKRQQYGWTNEALLIEDGIAEKDARAMLAEFDSGEAAGETLDNPADDEAQRLLEQALRRE